MKPIATDSSDSSTDTPAGTPSSPFRDGPKWWQGAVVYQIYPRSFADGDGDGVGDLVGLANRMSYIADLGVDAIWLSPIFPSPGRDFGYDVSDYCDIDPAFGSLEIFDALVASAHDAGLRVLLDWVPNHTSDQHRWFVDACTGRDAAYRDFYVWADPPADGTLPNNWLACFPPGTPAWSWHEPTGQFYLHNFLASQPDLNWENPAVEAAMLDTLRFWLDRGVDGFRMDVIGLIRKPAGLADDPEGWVGSGLPHLPLNDVAETHDHLRNIRSMLDGYAHEPTSVGEVYLLSPEQVATYLGDGDELHMSFNFAPIYAPWAAADFRTHIDDVERYWPSSRADARWPTWVLSNHDQPRHRTRFGSLDRARAAAVMLLGLRGTVFLYAGEELGLPDATIPPDRVVDPGGRDGCRAPIPWTADSLHGWGDDPWLPFVDDAAELCVERQEADPSSTLHLYRQILEARGGSPALRFGTFEWIDGGLDNVLIWRRRADGDERVVVVNMSSNEVDLSAIPELAGLTIELSSRPLANGNQPNKGDQPGNDNQPKNDNSGRLSPDEARILRPAQNRQK